MDRQYDAWIDAQELKWLAARRLQAPETEGPTTEPSVWGWVHSVLLALAVGLILLAVGLGLAAPSLGWTDVVEERAWVPASGWKGGAR